MPSKHTVTRVDPGLPQPDNTLNDDLVNADAVTSPDHSLENEDSLTGEAIDVSSHDASEAGTGTRAVDGASDGALEDEDVRERAFRDDEALTNTEGDEVDAETAAKAREAVRRNLH